MKTHHLIFSALVVIVLGWSGCTVTKTQTQSADNHDFLLMSVSWYQNSGEMQALCYQAFNIARLRFDEAVKNNTANKPLAVVVDIDETMLNNSPYETYVITKGEDRNGWISWTDKSAAKALPGAVEFARYVQQQHAEMFYITNRDDHERTATLKNLVKEGFPFADESHLLTRSDTAYSNGNTSSKAGRRAKVSSTHEIVLLLGDNLNDFSELFEDRQTDNGKAAVEENREQFGKRFIVLPNPMYGAWEKPLYDYKSNLNGKQKTELLKSKLK
jgi:5'-nucleotidase (lipoprotein e(P4) family)